MRLVFFGTPDYAVPSLERLSEEHEVVAVYCQPDRPAGRGHKLQPPPVKTAALSRSIPVFQPLHLKDEESKLSTLAADAFIVVAYGLILPAAILSIPRLGCINAHGSLLPKYRGASPIQSAILEGETISGVTTMLMDEHCDTGPILLKREIEIGERGTVELTRELSLLSATLLAETLQRLSQIVPSAQNENDASLSRKLKKSDGLVDWSDSAEVMVRKMRAFEIWPGLSVQTASGPLRLVAGQALAESNSAKPGTVIKTDRAGIYIATVQGVLVISALKPPGKRVMTASDYLRGHPIPSGQQLGV